MSEQLERNKQTVMAFYDVMFNQCQPTLAMERYAGEAYIQHNPAGHRLITWFTHIESIHCDKITKMLLYGSFKI